MVNVKAKIEQQHYTSSLVANGIAILADETKANGGEEKGFTPSELLAASLAACTAITCRMYADRKEWELISAEVDVQLQTIDGVANFNRSIHYNGPLNEEQKDRLTQIANNCPIHKILSHTIKITTIII